MALGALLPIATFAARGLAVGGIIDFANYRFDKKLKFKNSTIHTIAGAALGASSILFGPHVAIGGFVAHSIISFVPTLAAGQSIDLLNFQKRHIDLDMRTCAILIGMVIGSCF